MFGVGRHEHVLLISSLVFFNSLSLPSLPGQVFFVESVCDDPDVIAANILVGDTPAYHSLLILCAFCVCIKGESQVGKERKKSIFSSTG